MAQPVKELGPYKGRDKGGSQARNLGQLVIGSTATKKIPDSSIFNVTVRKLKIPKTFYIYIFQTRCIWGCSTNTFVIDSVSQSVILFLQISNYHKSKTLRAIELKF